MIARRFAEYFDAWGLALPAGAVERRRSGEIEQAGWHVRWVAADDGAWLDVLASHRMTNTRHVRLHASGEVEDLPCYHEFVVWDPDGGTTEAEAHQANAAHNRDVYNMLRDKGLED